MSVIEIQGCEYQVQQLTPANQARYFLMITRAIRALPDKPEVTPDVFLAIATKVRAVKELVAWACMSKKPRVTKANAMEVFLALMPCIVPLPPVKLTGQAAIDKLREMV